MVINMYYIHNFVFYSIMGYIFETLTALIFNINSESGFMYGPYTIVYGISITLIFLLYKKFTKTNPIYLIFLFLILISMIIAWIV